MNVGLTTITDLIIDWTLDGGPVHTTTFTGLSVPLLGTYDFTCTDLLNAGIGTHLLTVWINRVNGVVDDDQDNDTLQKTIKKACTVIPRKPCFEEFTSSTCGPCASFNSGFVPWCTTNEDNITLIKYQMNWPGAGDPYYTEEGGVRRDYYGVGWVPWLNCNGSYVETNMTAVQNAYTMALQQPGLLDIVASHSLSGTVMSVNAAALPFVDLTNTILHVIVFEYVTTQNASTNGETEFHHVMMKMMPDAYGTGTDLADRQPFSTDLSADLAGTFVEEWDDLGVLVFLQDFQSKEIYQSFYSVENATYNDEARLSDIQADGTSIPGFDPDVFTYDLEVPGGVLIPEITGTPMDPNATVIVVPAETIPGTTTIDVFGEDLVSHGLYEVNLIYAVGQEEGISDAMRIYPNPTTGMIYISGAELATISLYSPNGSLVKTVSGFHGPTFRMAEVPNGAYMLRVERQDGTVVQKRVIVVK